MSQQREGGKGKKERQAFARLMTGHLQVERSGVRSEGGRPGRPCTRNDFAASPPRRRERVHAPPINASTKGKARLPSRRETGKAKRIPRRRPHLSQSQQASVGTDEHFAESA